MHFIFVLFWLPEQSRCLLEAEIRNELQQVREKSKQERAFRLSMASDKPISHPTKGASSSKKRLSGVACHQLWLSNYPLCLFLLNSTPNISVESEKEIYIDIRFFFRIKNWTNVTVARMVWSNDNLV